MLPVSAWPPGPPGADRSPFGAPRTINVGQHAHGYVLPKGAWIVRTGSNRVVMFTPSWEAELYNQPCRAMGTGYLPGQWAYPRQPIGPPRPTKRVFNVRANMRWSQGPDGRRELDIDVPAEALAFAATPISPKKKFDEVAYDARSVGLRAVSRETQALPARRADREWRPPLPQRFMTHDAYLEAWRAWQRRVGRTDPPIRPIPGRRPPNWAGWRFVGAPSKTLVPAMQSGLVVADGQNVVIQGAGLATIVQAYSV